MLLFFMILADITGAFIAYCFGTFLYGRLVWGAAFWHWLGEHLYIVERIINFYLHVSPWWHQQFLRASTALTHTDVRAWGYLWIIFFIALKLASIQRSIRRLLKERKGLGKPYPGDMEWSQVEGCYQQFRKAALQYPPPIAFRTPHSFRYKVGKDSYEVEFIGQRLVIGEHLLTRNNRHLPPLLAHNLAYFNSADLWFKLFLDCCPDTWFIRFCIIGMPIALSTLIREYIWPIVYWKNRVFVADMFACQLGQCDALIKTLEARKSYQRRRGPFRTEPYIQERINRLKHWRINQKNPTQSSTIIH